ncbi:MAG: Uma2 family endonuclease [Leptolyngbyaceae cyanobacterium]
MPLTPIAAPQPTFTAKADGKIRWTVQTWQRAYDAGLFGLWDRYELLDGELYYVPTSSPQHDSTIENLVESLRELLAAQSFKVREEKVVYIADDSTPRPDISIVTQQNYRDRHAAPADVYLIIEVCQTSYINDLDLKPSIYAAAGIPEYWVVHLKNEQIKRFYNPVDGKYQETVLTSAVNIAGVDIAAAEMLAIAFGS